MVEDVRDPPLLQVDHLGVSFPTDDGRVLAVRDVSWTIRPGEVLGIVGESGSGKSAMALALMGLLPSTAAVAGSARFQGEELVGRPPSDLQRLRGSRISIIFQDPMTSLNPVMSIGDQITETIRIHQGFDHARALDRAAELLDLVGIPDARRRLESYPHQFSGGMRQRAVIAMAIANDPALLIADEPTTALDVTIQAQVLDVLQRVREVAGSAMVLITHDMGVVARVADRILVMYAGRVAEVGPVDDVFEVPRHPYTRGLLASIPRLDDPDGRRLVPIEGMPPSMLSPPPGCAFHPRCPMAHPICRDDPAPLLREIGRGGQFAACHFADELVEPPT